MVSSRARTQLPECSVAFLYPRISAKTPMYLGVDHHS